MHGIVPAQLAGKRGYLPVIPSGPKFQKSKMGPDRVVQQYGLRDPDLAQDPRRHGL